MKMLARSYVFWPNIDSDIQSHVDSCNVCQLTQKREHLTSKCQQGSYPFIHLDFFHFAFLILDDSYSKYIEVKIMSRTNASHLIQNLKSFFAIFGLPTGVE